MPYDPTQPEDPLASMWSELRKYGIENPVEKEQEASLIRDLANKAMSGLQYVGETLDKPGQAVRGALAGKPWELLNLIPFSDTLGITSSEGLFGQYGLNKTDDEDAVSGRDLLEKWGALSPNQEGLDPGDIAGLGAEILTDPTTFWKGGIQALSKLGKAFQKAGQLADPYVLAKRAGKDVFGHAGARHELTALDLLKQAEDPAAAKAAVELALNKGKPGGKLIPEVADFSNYHYGDVAPTDVVSAAPATPTGHTRFFHGGSADVTGPRWVTPDETYARGYADKSGSPVLYVDVPNSDPRLTKLFDDTGTSITAPFSSFEAPEDLASLLKPVSAPATQWIDSTKYIDPKQLQDPIGGLFNIQFPFIDPLTVHLPTAAKWLDKATGKIRYGNPIGRGFNTLFDAGHTHGGAEDRFTQEFLIPSERLSQKQAANQLNQLIAQYKGQTQRGAKELAAAYPDELDPINQAYRASEGFGPDPLGMRDTTKQFGETAMDIQHRYNIPTATLQDDAIEDWLARRRIQGGGGQGKPSTPQLTARREEYRKDIVGGTARQRELDKFFASVREGQDLPEGITVPVKVDPDTGVVSPKYGPKRTLKELGKQYDEKYLAPKYGGELIPETYTTQAALEGIEQLANPELLAKMTPEQIAKVEAIVKKGTDRDRWAALASSAAKEDLDILRAGKFMDPAGAMQIVANATADRVGRSRAFSDALNEPNLAAQFGAKTPDDFIRTSAAAKQLGLDATAFDEAPEFVPKNLVKQLLYKPEPIDQTSSLGKLLNTAKNLTQLNKSFMTGAITNPSFHVRNRGSGAAENVYMGDVGPAAAATGLAKSLANMLTFGKTDVFKSPAQLLARGMDIPGAAQIPALQQKAAELGRTITSDKDASNLLRELYAAAGGHMGGQHTAESMLENQTGVGQFIGGMLGPEGPDAFSLKKVFQQMGDIIPQLRGQKGGKKELFFGVPGSDMANKGKRRTEATSALIKPGDTLGKYVEAQNRFGPWFEMFKQGYDPAEAMRRVNRSQIDYTPTNYTPFENNVATLIAPFYKFSKGSALAHANELATKPGGTLSHLLQTTGQLNDTEEVLPAHIKEKLSIPVEKIPLIGQLLASGDPNTKRFLTGTGLPYEDILTLITGGQGELPVGRETLNELLGRLNPMGKMLGELATGRSFFQRDETGSGRLLAEQDPTVGRLLSNLKQMLTGEELDSAQSKQAAKDLSLGIAGESMLANSPLSRLLSSFKTLTDQRPKSTRKALMNYFTGLRAADVDPHMQDAVIRGMINQDIGQMPYASTHTTAYIPKRNRQYLDDEKLAKLQQLQLLMRMLDKHQKQPAGQSPFATF